MTLEYEAGRAGDCSEPAPSAVSVTAATPSIAAASGTVARHPACRSDVVVSRRRVRLQRQSAESARVQFPADGRCRRARQRIRSARS